MRRITITIPEPLVRAADERSTALERSRSWVIVDALRHYLPEGRDEDDLRDEAPAVRETTPALNRGPQAAGLGPYRLAQLEADLQLSSLERVMESELAARVTELRTTPLGSERLLTFDRYEDFLEWERWEERAR